MGRTDIGSLEPGKCADLFALRLDRLEYAGALHDPLAAIVFCAPVNADYTMVGGRWIVKEGQLLSLDLPVLIEAHNLASRGLFDFV